MRGEHLEAKGRKERIEADGLTKKSYTHSESVFIRVPLSCDLVSSSRVYLVSLSCTVRRRICASIFSY